MFFLAPFRVVVASCLAALLLVLLTPLVAAAGPPPNVSRFLIENACRDEHLSDRPEPSPDVIPARSWTSFRIALELESGRGSGLPVRLRSVVRESSDGERLALPEQDQGRELGVATWDETERRWHVEERALGPSLREIVPEGWADVVLEQDVVNPALREFPRGAYRKSLPRWRVIGGERLGLELHGERVACPRAALPADLCWDGTVEIVRGAGREQVVGRGKIALRGRILRGGLGVGPEMYAEVTRTVRATIDLEDRRVDWSQDCRTTLRRIGERDRAPERQEEDRHDGA